MIRGDRNGIRFSLSVVFNCSQKMALHECSNISIGSVQMYVVKCVQGQHFNAIKNNWSVIQTINQNHQNSSSKFENHSIFSAIILSVPKHTKIVRSKEQHSQLETSISPDFYSRQNTRAKIFQLQVPLLFRIQFSSHIWIQGYLGKAFCWFSRKVFELRP